MYLVSTSSFPNAITRSAYSSQFDWSVDFQYGLRCVKQGASLNKESQKQVEIS